MGKLHIEKVNKQLAGREKMLNIERGCIERGLLSGNDTLTIGNYIEVLSD